LFNLFVEEIIDKYKENSKRISINGEKNHCIRFADDIVLVPESEKKHAKISNHPDENITRISYENKCK
jgi:hypothetical protein